MSTLLPNVFLLGLMDQNNTLLHVWLNDLHEVGITL